MSSSFGTLFRITTFGESHGPSVGAVVDGCPPKITLSEADIQPQLDRRRPAQSRLTTTRNEADRVSILSGVENGKTLGTPISLIVKNNNQRTGDYQQIHSVPRPSHADYTYQMKYGNRALGGGGRSSARETVARVAGGAIAEKLLYEDCGIEIVAWVSNVYSIEASSIDIMGITRTDVDRSIVRCPDSDTSEKIKEAILEAQKAGDSLGGIITCVCRNLPAGLGEPIFDKLEALLAQAMLSIPATKGFAIGRVLHARKCGDLRTTICLLKKEIVWGQKPTTVGVSREVFPTVNRFFFGLLSNQRRPSACPNKPSILIAMMLSLRPKDVMTPVWCHEPFRLLKV